MEAPGAELRPQTGPGGMFRHSTSGPQPPLPASAERTRTEGPDEMDDHAGLEDLTRRSLQELLKVGHELDLEGDRKSTRLNSSHVANSYAVFCLKKKTKGPSVARRVKT